MFLEYRERIAQAIKGATGMADPCLVDGGEHGDLASTIAFSLAKRDHTSPIQAAALLAKDLSSRSDLAGIGGTFATGPYINFTFGEGYLRDSIREALKPGYGTFPRRDDRVVIEHTSANPSSMHPASLGLSGTAATSAVMVTQARCPAETRETLMAAPEGGETA